MGNNFTKAIIKGLWYKLIDDIINNLNPEKINIYKTTKFIIIIFLIIIVPFKFIEFFSKHNALSLNELFQITILLATLLVIFWYTIETHNMHKAMVAQINLSVRPYFDLDCNRNGLKLTNVGNGVALNIYIGPIYTLYNRKKISFTGIHFLNSGKACLINYSLNNINEYKITFPSVFYRNEEKYLNRGFILEISYQDIQMNKYNQVLSLQVPNQEIEKLFM